MNVDVDLKNSYINSNVFIKKIDSVYKLIQNTDKLNSTQINAK